MNYLSIFVISKYDSLKGYSFENFFLQKDNDEYFSMFVYICNFYIQEIEKGEDCYSYEVLNQFQLQSEDLFKNKF